MKTIRVAQILPEDFSVKQGVKGKWQGSQNTPLRMVLRNRRGIVQWHLFIFSHLQVEKLLGLLMITNGTRENLCREHEKKPKHNVAGIFSANGCTVTSLVHSPEMKFRCAILKVPMGMHLTQGLVAVLHTPDVDSDPEPL